MGHSSLSLAILKNRCVTHVRLGMTPAAALFLIPKCVFPFPISFSPLFAICTRQLEENRPHTRGKKSVYICMYICNSTLNKRNSLEESRTASRERLLNLGMCSHACKHVYTNMYARRCMHVK